MNIYDENFIFALFAAQDEETIITGAQHQYALALIDAGLLGMDGFKYCRKQTAIENRRTTLAQIRRSRIPT